jgi:hypothetical protein
VEAETSEDMSAVVASVLGCDLHAGDLFECTEMTPYEIKPQFNQIAV